jgi:hypothetical protein
VQKGRYAYLNRRNQARWERMTTEERKREEEVREERGNRSVLFRFTT